MSGKGDKQRRQQAPDKHVRDEWERLFPKKGIEASFKTVSIDDIIKVAEIMDKQPVQAINRYWHNPETGEIEHIGKQK